MATHDRRDYQLPRPPPLFVGREHELAWLDVAFARSSVVCVSGPPGSGKTALLAAWWQRNSNRAAPLVLRATCLRSLHAQFCELLGLESVPNVDDETVPFALIDALEQHARTLIVDDAHGFEDPRQLTALCEAFANWSSRNGSLVVLSRMQNTVPTIAEQVLWLKNLSENDMRTLLRTLDPDASPDRMSDYLQWACGNPLEARRIVFGLTDERLAFAGLSEEALDLASILAHVEVLPFAEVKQQFPDAVRSLIARRIARSEGDALHMIDDNRDVFRRPLVSRARAAALASTLVTATTSRWRWAALWCTLESDDADGVERTLRWMDEPTVEALGSRRLFEALRRVNTAAAHRVRLLCVSCAPWPEGVQWLSTTHPWRQQGDNDKTENAEDLLAHANALFAMNKVELAAEAFKASLASKRGPHETAPVHVKLEALIGLSRTLAPLDAAEVVPQLEALELASVNDRQRARLWMAFARYRTGDRALGRKLAGRVFAERFEVTGERSGFCSELYYVLTYLGMLNDANQLTREVPLRRPMSARWTYIEAVAEVERGVNVVSDRRFKLLWQVGETSGRYRFLCHFLRERWFEHRDLVAATRELEQLWRLADAVGDPHFVSDCYLYEHLLSLWTARDPVHRGPVPDEHCHMKRLVDLRRFGPGHELDSLDGLEGTSHHHQLLRAELSWLQGQPDRAFNLLDEEARDAGRRGALLEEADTLAAFASLYVRTPNAQRAAARDLYQRLQRVALETDLGELVRLATGLRVFEQPARPTRATLEGLNCGIGLIARLARQLLDTENLRWESDRAALRNLNVRWGLEAPERHAVLDAVHRVVRSPTDEVLDLGKHPLLFRIVETLFKHGSVATKEQLAREAWDLPNYRAARDDKRIHVALGRLRTLIAAGGFPLTIETTPTGYSAKLRA